VKENEQQDSENAHLSWHPAFIEVIKMELDQYKDALEFYPEYQLTSSRPIALLVIRILLGLRHVAFIHLHAHRFACFFWAR